MRITYLATMLLVLVAFLGCVQQDGGTNQQGTGQDGTQLANGADAESNTFNSEDAAFDALEKELSEMKDTGFEDMENLLT